jgi:hypothetical protein
MIFTTFLIVIPVTGVDCDRYRGTSKRSIEIKSQYEKKLYNLSVCVFKGKTAVLTFYTFVHI